MKNRILAPASATLALVGAITAGLGLYQLARIEAEPRPAFLLTFDVAADAQARKSILANEAKNTFRDARILANAAIRENAYNNVSRLRLVYMDAAEHGRPTPAGLKLLQQSYDLAPYDPYSASWRTLFVLEYWNVMTPAIRAAAQQEATAFLKSGSRVADMRNTLQQVRNPDGRMVATLWTLSLE